MITIKYTIPIYIRMTPDDYETELSGECFIINGHDDHNYVFYQNDDDDMLDVADFIRLNEAIEYCKLKIDLMVVNTILAFLDN